MYSSLFIHLLTRVIRVVLNFTILILMAALISPNEMAVYAAILTGFALFAPFLDGVWQTYIFNMTGRNCSLRVYYQYGGHLLFSLIFIAHPVLEQVFNLTLTACYLTFLHRYFVSIAEFNIISAFERKIFL